MENEPSFTGAEYAALSIYPSVFRLVHLASVSENLDRDSVIYELNRLLIEAKKT